MQSAQQRSPANFNNPFQSNRNGPHYRMNDSAGSDGGNESPTLGRISDFNGQNNRDNTAEEVVIDFRPNTTENPLNVQSTVTDRDPAFTAVTNPELTEANVPIEQNPVPNQDGIQKLIRDVMLDIIKFNVFGLFGSVLGIVSLQLSLPYLYILVFLWLCNTFNIISLSHKNTTANANKTQNAMGIVSSLLSAVFKVFLVIRIETNSMMITIPLIPVLVSDTISLIMKCYKNRRNTIGTFYKIEALFKFLIIVQTLMISLKFDDIIDWKWRQVFFAYWIIFAVTAGIGFAFFLMFTSKCCAYMFAEMDVYEVRGVFWLFFIIGGKTILSCTAVLQSISILQGQSELSLLLGVSIAISVYTACVIIYTGIFFKEIEAMWKKIAVVDINALEDDLETGDNKKSALKIEPEKVDIPKFLTKFSSTYFRRSTNDEVQKSKDKDKNKDAKNNKEQDKITTRRRQNSLDYQRIKANVTGLSTTNLNLLTVPETEGERTKTTDWNNTSRFGLRPDKGKDFFANITNRTGVSGIIPSGIMSSKTDRFQTGPGEGIENKDYSPLTSNDSCLLPPISRDTDAPLRPYRGKDRISDRFFKGRTPELTASNTPDISPLGVGGGLGLAGITDVPDEIEESQATICKLHRRVQSMQDVSPTQVISLSEALESPKVKESARENNNNPLPLMSPTSDSSAAVQCLICFDNVPDAVFMECGHGGVCYECSLEIWKSTNECYLCRNAITQVLQVDLKAKMPNHVIKVLSSTQMVLYEEEEETE